MALSTPGPFDEPPASTSRRAWLVPRWEGPAAWIETLVITLIAILLGWLADHEDPLLTKAAFPWVWFAPVLAALRYGVIPGVASAAILIGAWYLLTPGSLDLNLPKVHVLGGLLLTLVCGEFGASWRSRLRRANELSRYLDDRLERVTRQLYLLRLSHDRLEQELLARPTTLRDALAQLRPRLAGQRGGGPLPGANEMLQFLAQHCQLEVAAIYATDRAANPTFKRVAVLGNAPPLTENDPLLTYVLEEGELAHVQIEGMDESLPTQQIVVCPIQTGARELLGVLAVARMPFFALTDDQLRLMRVLTGTYADGVAITPLFTETRRALPDVPEDFGDELARLTRIQRDFEIASHVVVMLIGDTQVAGDIQQLLLRQRRAPDIVWTPQRAPHRATFVNLLPISGQAGVEGYLARTENALRENFGQGFADLRVRTFSIALDGPDPAARLANILASGVDDVAARRA